MEHNQLLDFYTTMTGIIQDKMDNAVKSQPRQTFRSTSIDKLALALSGAQGAYTKVRYNRNNKLTRDPYVDIEAILEMVKEPLKNNELAITQLPETTDEGTILETWLFHSSGQFVGCRGRLTMVAGNMKLFSSTLNELRKQHLLSILGIAPASYEDDDCEEETKLKRIETDEGTSIAHNHGFEPEDNYERINKTELDELDYHLTTDLKDVYRDILKTYHITHLADLPKEKYRLVLDQILRIKKKRKEPDSVKLSKP